MPYKVTIPEGRSANAGDPVISQNQPDGSVKHWIDGAMIKPSDIPDDGWEWLLAQGLVISTGRKVASDG